MSASGSHASSTRSPRQLPLAQSSTACQVVHPVERATRHCSTAIAPSPVQRTASSSHWSWQPASVASEELPEEPLELGLCVDGELLSPPAESVAPPEDEDELPELPPPPELSESEGVSEPEESVLSPEERPLWVPVWCDESPLSSPASESVVDGDAEPSSPHATTHPKAPKTSQLLRMVGGCSDPQDKSTSRHKNGRSALRSPAPRVPRAGGCECASAPLFIIRRSRGWWPA